MMTTGVGVVVMDLDQQKLTARCLRSLANGTKRPDVVVLVENGRGSVTLDERGKAYAEVGTVILRPGRNLQCAAGRNLGLNYLLQNTDLETMIVLDNDTVASPEFIEMITRRPPQPLDVLAPVIFDLASGKVWSSGGTIFANGSIKQFDDLPNDPNPWRRVDWAPGACLVMHRDTWAEVGEFDPWLEFLFEDIEWCHRLIRAGGRVLVCPQLRVEHEPHQSLGGRWSPARVRYWARNGTLFRISVAKAGLRPTLRWLVGESLLSIRDLLGGRLPWAAARIVGLSEGLIEAGRRRMRTHGEGIQQRCTIRRTSRST